MLKDLTLQPVYDSADCDLIQDLIIPLLQNSIFYIRGVGFFTSGWLQLAARGVHHLVNNNGKANIVVSPILERSDWEALQLGERAKHDHALKNILDKHLEEIKDALEDDTLNTLAWMVADEILDFRFAVPKEYSRGGDYHDKVGIFIDVNGDRVAIHGSFNDTYKGSLNGEAFSVFKSWEKGQYPFVEQHHRRLNQLWTHGNRQFHIITIPEAVRKRIITLRSTLDRPYILPEKISTEVFLKTDVGLYDPFNLYAYQKEAIENWISANCRAVFEMATGTGKTITSLSAAVNRYNKVQRLALIILVPYLHLLEQWEGECRKVGFNPILCSSAHNDWHLKVKSKIQDFNIKALNHICILAVHDTASTDKFAKATKNLKTEYTMIIGDEVHELGAPILKKAMVPNAGMRLGLSATPKRWFDEAGTNIIFNYFGPVCFEFPLEKAIGKYLTPYEYNPELVSLIPDELDIYETLTVRIGQLSRLIENEKTRIEPEIEVELKKLLLERAHIVASAHNKLEQLIIILSKMIHIADNTQILNHILIYCAPGTHKKVLRAVANLGLRCHEFVHTVSLSDRQKILDQFSSGEIQAIVAIKCLDEGIDIPSTRTAFFLSSTSNPREFVQRRGRILRLAKGKEKAIVYDFIVVPRPEYIPLKRDIDAGLLRREMPRFAEFASASTNEFSAREKIWDLLNHYELLDLLDKKPWDIYNNILNSKKNIFSL